MDTEILIRVLGCVLIVAGVINLVKRNKRSQWPSTTGRVGESKIETHEHDYVEVVMGRAKHKTTKSHVLHFAYEYLVDGQAYRSSSIYSAPLSWTALEDVLPFTFGSEHEVWFNPQKPQQAYLKKSSYTPSVLLASVGAFFAVTGIESVVWMQGLLG